MLFKRVANSGLAIRHAHARTISLDQMPCSATSNVVISLTYLPRRQVDNFDSVVPPMIIIFQLKWPFNATAEWFQRLWFAAMLALTSLSTQSPRPVLNQKMSLYFPRELCPP